MSWQPHVIEGLNRRREDRANHDPSKPTLEWARGYICPLWPFQNHTIEELAQDLAGQSWIIWAACFAPIEDTYPYLRAAARWFLDEDPTARAWKDQVRHMFGRRP